MDSRQVSRVLLGLAALLLTASCQSGLYSWGSYEDSVHALCFNFEEADLTETLAHLDEHVSRLRDHGLPPGPGMYAQLGYLEYLAGNQEIAAGHFKAEKGLYPESSVFMDGLLRRMGAQ